MKISFSHLLGIAVLGASLSAPAFATSLAVEQFNYAAASTVALPLTPGGPTGATSWITLSGTAGQCDVAASGLSYTGLAASAGNALNLTETESEDITLDFTPVTDGGSGFTVYASAVVQFTALPSTVTNGNYFFHLTQAASTSAFFGRAFARANAGNVEFGVRGSSTDGPVFAAPTIALNTPTLIVLKYESVVGATNDIASIFINPTPGAAEPVASATTTPSAEPAAAGIGRVSLRQSLSTGEGMGTLVIDEIRVGTTWADVTPAAATVNDWTVMN